MMNINNTFTLKIEVDTL